MILFHHPNVCFLPSLRRRKSFAFCRIFLEYLESNVHLVSIKKKEKGSKELRIEDG